MQTLIYCSTQLTYQMKIHCFFIVLLSVLLSLPAYSQTTKFSLHANAGTLLKVLDTGIGFHAGIQPHYAIWKYFGIDGLFNCSYTIIKAKFISGQSGHEANINMFLGGRVYFAPPEHKNRAFVNLLIGPRYHIETLGGTARTPVLETAGSFGVYYQPSRFLVGAGIESRGHLFFRFGINVLQ